MENELRTGVSDSVKEEKIAPAPRTAPRIAPKPEQKIEREKKMSRNLFVSRKDKIDVNVYVYDDSTGMTATHDKESIPETAKNVETFTFTFKQPTYSESNDIIRRAQISSTVGGAEDVVNTGNIMGMQTEILNKLLVAWDLTDDDGNPVPRTPARISDLHPDVARSAVAGALLSIKI